MNQEQSTTAGSSNEARVELRSNKKAITIKDSLAGQPFPVQRGVTWSDIMPQENPEEPLKVFLDQKQFWNPATKIKATEGPETDPAEKHKWECTPIEAVPADRHFLQGGARGCEGFQRALHGMYACDRCHCQYAHPTAIAFYTDPSLRMPMGKIELFNIYRQAEAQMRQGDMQKIELIATQMCYAACYKCVGEVIHNDEHYFDGEEPGTVARRFRKISKKSRVTGGSPKALQKDVDRAIKASQDKIRKAVKKGKDSA